MTADLHTHTTFSDGSTEIEYMPCLAQRAGLTHLAVSDHDTPLAAQYAYAHPCEMGVTLIPAVELTAFDTQRTRRVHLLCYYPDLTPALRAYFDVMAGRRNAAAAHSIRLLEERYPQFDVAQVRQAAVRSGVIYKTHLIRHLYELGYTDGIYQSLYRTLFDSQNGEVLSEPAYESVTTMLQLAREARAVIVLAHPSVYHSVELCAQLAAQGCLDGIEVWHPRNTAEDQQELRRIAKRYHLIETGGTDFHGMHMSRPAPLGSVRTDDANLQRLMQLAHTRKLQAAAP